MNTQLTLYDARGPLIDLTEKLSGEEGSQWLQSLKKFLRKENPWEGMQAWKTIKLGTHKNADALRKTLEKNYRIGDWANDILGKSSFVPSVKETEVDLVNISVAELGFKNGATRDKIYDRALELGLELCPAEVGPQLRLQYKNQPKGEWLRVAMDPIADSLGLLDVFFVYHHSGDLWLNAYSGNPVSFWQDDSRWVFVLRK